MDTHAVVPVNMRAGMGWVAGESLEGKVYRGRLRGKEKVRWIDSVIRDATKL